MGIRAKLAAVCGVALFACGGPPDVRAPDGTITPVKPVVTQVGAPEKHEVKRPEEVIAWIHVDDPDGFIDLLGIPGSPYGAEVMGWVDLIDAKQPMDVAFVMNEDKDPEIAVRIPVKDSAAILKKVGTFYTLKEQGARVFAREGDDEESKPLFECDFTAPTRGPDVMICGMGKAIDMSGEWLRNAPTPKREHGPRATGQPLGRVSIYGKAMQKVVESSHETQLVEFINDAEALQFELDREGSKLVLAGMLRLKSQKSEVAKQILMPTPGGTPSDAFGKIWDVASAAVYSPGGGPLPAWAKEIIGDSDKSSKKSTVADKISKLFEKSFAAGYGVRPDKVKAGVVAMRSGKDKDKAKRDLATALEGQLMFSVAVESTVMQSTMKDAVPIWNEEAKHWMQPDPGKKPIDRFSIKTAGANLALPKGSFLVVEKSVDWDPSAMAAVTPGTVPTTKYKDEPTLFVPEGSSTWGFYGGDEAAVAELAKKILANKKPPEADPIFKKPGVVFAGYFGSTVGAFSMHRYDVKYGNPTPEVLADLEKDAASPRLPLAFVVTNEKKGDGGNIAIEAVGERAAVQVLGEHVSELFFGSIGYMLMAFMPRSHGRHGIP